jgi:hypothetical protein
MLFLFTYMFRPFLAIFWRNILLEIFWTLYIIDHNKGMYVGYSAVT